MPFSLPLMASAGLASSSSSAAGSPLSQVCSCVVCSLVLPAAQARTGHKLTTTALLQAAQKEGAGTQGRRGHCCQ